MNLKQLKNIIESAKNNKSEPDTFNYLFEVYLPVSEAIAGNDRTVIKYLLGCEAGDRFSILNAIEDGAKRLSPLKSYKLLGMIRQDKKLMYKMTA